jgi:hypothetical protein
MTKDEVNVSLFDECKRLQKRVRELEEGGCRFNCRTEKENWIEGFNWARWQPAKHDNARDAEVEYNEWKMARRKGQRDAPDRQTEI